MRLQQALAGRYSLERELGRGGMGIVYLAREVSLDRPVALKILPPEFAAQTAARERFLHEARTAARLSHPNVVPIFAVDEVDEFVLFAMAFIEGETLGHRVRSRGPRPPSEVARILREVAWALAYAHAQGVIHRDVKPDNILLEAGSGRALVADFGIASVAASTEAGAGQVSGTAEFMSPEQAKGEPAGPASDTYSLGVVGFYALSGAFPFEGSTAPAILAKHISESAPPVASVAHGVPSKLARTIDRCLAKDIAERFTDEELAEALGQVVAERRDLPVPLRAFVKRHGAMGSGGTVLYVFVLASLSGTVAAIAPFGLGTVAGYATFIAGLTLVPVGIVLNRVRRLVKSGYGQEELAVAYQVEIDRSREEGAFEFGHGPSLYERVVRVISGLGLGLAALTTIALAAVPELRTLTLELTLAYSLTVGAGAGVLALVRLQRRRDINNELRSRFWSSLPGSWLFRLAHLGLRKVPEPGSPTLRPTELAIGMAADRLFDELPRELRRPLRDLPEVVRKLEADARRMRQRMDELDMILPQVRSDRPESRALRAGLQLPGPGNVVEQRRKLEADLRAARDATQQRLADAIAALETIRLSLLRMHAGTASVESVTGDLAAARDVAEDIDRLLDAQQEVDVLLREE